MPLTPGSAQVPLVPNEQLLYISNPFTTGLIAGPSAAALQESLFCYAYAQGYTGLLMYEMSQFVSGTSLTNGTQWVTFINAAAAKGIDVYAVFGSTKVLDAVINFNTANPTSRFKGVISEIEWWNYSHNLPFQQPGTGSYSYFEVTNFFINYKPLLTAAGLALLTYNGFTKPANGRYVSGFTTQGTYPSINSTSIICQGNFTSDNTAPIDESKFFEANQVIRIENWPVQGNHTYYKLDATTPTTLVGGNTALKVGLGKECSGVDSSTSLAIGTPTGQTFTGNPLNARTTTATNISFTTVSGTPCFVFTTSTPHLITTGTFVEYPTGTIVWPNTTGSTSSQAVTGTTGNTLILPASLITISSKASSGTLATITTTNPHYLPSGATLELFNLGTGYDGSKVITVTSPTTFTFSTTAPAQPVTPTSTGFYRITSLPTTVLSPQLTFRARNITSSKVRNVFEVTSITPAGPIHELRLRGNKTFYAANNRLKKVEIYGLSSGNGLFSLASSTATYDALNNETVFQVSGYPGAGTPNLPGFLFAAASFDIVGDANGSYGDGSELQQHVPYVDVFGIHNYVNGAPIYRSVDATRLIELGTAGVNISKDVKVSWIISAQYPPQNTSQYSGLFFQGKGGLGGPVIYPPKNPIDAYKYITYPISPAPSPTQSLPALSGESNANVQARVYIDGITIFKDTVIRNWVSGNGPNIWVNAGNDVSLTANAGTVNLTGQYCDDCLPNTNYTYTWSIVSATPPGGGTVTPNTVTAISGCINNSIPGTFNFTSPGVYTVRLTINDNSGTAPTVAAQDDININIASVASGPFTIDINPDDLPTCANSNDGGLLNDGNLTASITAVQGAVKPVTYNWTGPNGYTNSTIDSNLAFQTSSSTINSVVAGVYTVTAIDSSSPPRSGTQSFTLDAAYPFNNLLSTLVVNASCYGANDGSITAILSDPNYCAGLVFTDIIPDYEFNIPADWTLQSTWLANPISVAGGKLVLENTTVFNPLVTYNQWDAQAGPAGTFLPALDTIVFSYNIQTGAWPQNNTTIAIRDKFGAIIPILGPGTVSPNTTYTGTFTLTGQGTNPASTVQITVVDNTAPVIGRIYEILRFRLRYQSGTTPGSNNLFYDWSNGVNGYGANQITSLTAGTYTVEVTDCHGCTATLSSTVTEPDAIIPFISATNTTCGLSNGTVTIDSMTGGVAPFTYLWSNGATTSSLTNVPADFYSVTVTDSIGCTGVSNFVQVLGSSSFITGILGPVNVCCDTPIQYSVLLPIGSFTWTWSNGQTGVNPATYIFSCNDKTDVVSVTVTNTDTGCIVTESIFVTINTPTNPVTAIKVLSGDPNNLTTCIGDEVVISPFGGVGTGSWNFGSPASTTNPLTVNQAWFNTYGTPGQPFTFIWSEVDPTTTCYSEASITINYPIGVVLNIDVTPVVCNGAPNSGAIDVEVVSSCGAPFDISWSGPLSNSDTFSGSTYTIPNLVTGTYSVTVTDVEGNIATEPNIVVFVGVPVIDNAVVTNYCFNTPVGSNNGSIDITVTGGTPPYTYLWTRTGDLGFLETTQDISNLSLGEYTVVVTDDNGCTATDTYIIEYSDPIEIDVTIAPPSCWGLCNGFIGVEVSGGTAPYVLTTPFEPPYTLPASSFVGFKQICATTYTINVVDANGCTAVKEFNVGANTDVTQFTTRVVNPSSEDAQDGAIYIDLISGGGGPPYDYLWTGPNGFTATTQDITDLAPGDYEVTIETVVFGVPQPTCAVTRKFKLQTSCVEFSLEELKVMLFKFQCCAGVLAKEYVQYQEIGRPDLAECKLIDLKYLTLAINTLSCINELPDACLSCEDISNILNQIKKICDCDCCDDAATGVYNVTYNPFTGQLDSN